jgi:opacity protein-like surface antigen
VAFGAAHAAQAADLAYPPPPPEFIPAEPVQFGGWYLRGDVGAGIAAAPNFRSSFYDENYAPLSAADVSAQGIGRDSERIGDSAIIGVGVGYQYNPWLRFDATGEYRTAQQLNALEHYDASVGYNSVALTNGTPTIPSNQYAHDEYNGQVQSSVFLVNAYADLGTWYRMTPFLGGGVGFSYNHLSAMIDRGAGVDLVDANGNVVAAQTGEGGFGYTKAVGKLDLAWAAMAGVSYDISRNVKLELSYRYLDMGSINTGLYQCNASCTHENQRISLASNDVRLGLRWMFGSADIAPQPVYYPPPPPEQPIIRKY